MSIEHQVMLHTPYGVRLKELKFQSLDMVRKDMEVGAMSIVLDGLVYDYDDFKRDMVISFERSVDGDSPYLEGETLWFVRGRKLEMGSRSPSILTITCEDAMTLLKRRLIAYFNGESQTEKFGIAGDEILEIIRENLGTSAIAGRDLSSFLSIPSNTGLGVSIEKDQFGWSPLLNVITDLAKVSEQAGTYITFDVVCGSPPTNSTSIPTFSLGFNVYSGQRRQDHRYPSGSPPILVGPDLGNLDEIEISDSWAEEQTYLYAGGEGNDDTRLIVEVSNSFVISASPLGRVEGWFDDRDQDISSALTYDANGELHKRLTRTKMRGRFLDTPSIRWGREIKFGDRLTSQVKGINFDCRANTDHIMIDRESGEQLDIHLEGEIGQ